MTAEGYSVVFAADKLLLSKFGAPWSTWSQSVLLPPPATKKPLRDPGCILVPNLILLLALGLRLHARAGAPTLHAKSISAETVALLSLYCTMAAKVTPDTLFVNVSA